MTVDLGTGITSYKIGQIAKNYPRALVPIGSLEQHGEHLPLATDLIIAQYVTKRIADRVKSFVLPPINYGISVEHSPLFNVSLKYSTLISVVNDISTSLSKSGIKRVIYLNGHHGNSGALQYVMHSTNGSDFESGFSAYSVNYWNMTDDEFDHGGEVETSLMLAIRPDYVSMNRARPSTLDRPKLKRTYQTLTNNPGAFPKVTGNGVWGDPRNASRKKGQELLKTIIKNTTSVILELDEF